MSINRFTQKEQARTNDLIALIPATGKGKALDVGARDGYFSNILTQYYDQVVALDLQKPAFEISNVRCVEGNIIDLRFDDRAFDFVLCTEVLEHIPSDQLEVASQELARVTDGYLLIGVPFSQDLRIGQTTCPSCGKVNPPWGHVNSFDEVKLKSLFSSLEPVTVSYVEKNYDLTNALSSFLLKLAGNPYGTYVQEEPCVFCGGKIFLPSSPSIFQRIFVKMSRWLVFIQKFFFRPSKPQWVHILFRRP